MPVKMLVSDRGAIPVVMCDVCGTWIQRTDEGSYTWIEEPADLGTVCEVGFTHQGLCFLTYILTHRAAHHRPLEVLMPSLAASLGVDWGAATKLATYFP